MNWKLPPLADILAKLAPCDLVIVEGYKRDAHDKIEVRNLVLENPVLGGEDASVVAVAASGPVTGSPVPVFDRNDVAGLTAFVIKHTGLA